MSDNLALWDKLGRTDPDHTKKFKRGGGFSGTAVKPIYTAHKMTEAFGPCGTGWGYSEPSFQLVPGSDGQTAVFCWLSLWYVKADGARSEPIPGVGGDFVIKKFSSGLTTDDEAFKKAFTDALGNAMKNLGMSADVHMGRFDDSKYVAELTREFAEEKQAAEAAPALAYIAESRKRIADATDRAALLNWWNSEDRKACCRDFDLTESEIQELKQKVSAKASDLQPKVAA